jgi:hypothetical protein
MLSSTRTAIALAFLLGANAPVAWGEATTPDDVPIQRYGDVDKTCLAWTDGCRNCSRAADDAPICSNIGISCQPKAVGCTARKKADKGEK